MFLRGRNFLFGRLWTLKPKKNFKNPQKNFFQKNLGVSSPETKRSARDGNRTITHINKRTAGVVFCCNLLLHLHLSYLSSIKS